MFDPNPCPCRPDLEAFWDDELAEETAGAVRRHLIECAACATEHREQEQFTLLLREGDPTEPLSGHATQRLRADLLQRAMADLQQNEASPRPVERKRSGWVRAFWSLSPAVVAALLVAWWVHSAVPSGKKHEVAGPAPATPPGTAPVKSTQRLTQSKPPRQAERLTQSVTPRAALPLPDEFTSDPPTRRPAGLSRTTGRALRQPSLPPRAPHVAPEPAHERLVFDVSGAPGLSRPQTTHVTLIASGSPDAPDGEIVVIHTEASEETP